MDAGRRLWARGRDEDLRLVEADMWRLPFRSGSCGLIVSYYAIQHVVREEVGPVLAEMARVLSPGGTLVVAAHLGEGDVLTRDFLGHQIAAVGGTFLNRQELIDALEAARYVARRPTRRHNPRGETGATS